MIRSKNEENKIKKKIERCKKIIESEICIEFSETSRKNIVICNAGLSTGLTLEDLLDEVQQYSPVERVSMVPGKSFCFVEFKDSVDAQTVYNKMNAISKLGQKGGILYMAFCESIPMVENPWETSRPYGLILLEDIISDEEEQELLKILDMNAEESEDHGLLKQRKVKHYGFEFIYKNGQNNVDVDNPINQLIPREFDKIFDRIRSRLKVIEFSNPDQMTVNCYEPGQGIPPHIDTPSAFEDPIFSLSLGSNIVMDFRNGTNIHSCIDLPRKSMLILSKESRYKWSHGITSRMSDVLQLPQGLTTRKRELRISCTFRKIIKNQEKTQTQIDDSTAAKLELENVHKVYDEISQHFSETRHSPWPEIENFLLSFSKFSLILDIGCGNGKYLGVNKDIMTFGCDRSEGLLSVCMERKFNAFKCDCLSVPFKENIMDGVISIAVFHHLATKERRIQAISEMGRVLVPGGKGLIYVWAKNQAADNKKSSYLRQNKKNQEAGTADVQEFQGVSIPIHKNRTQFQHQDVMVPWKLKEQRKEFLRFYHVFEEGELEEHIRMIPNLKITKNYYDQGNWCVIFEKI